MPHDGGGEPVSTTMPAITLIQPWASLIACGAKRFETRSWSAPAALIGRTIAIHAGKNRTEGADLMASIFGIYDHLPVRGYRIHNDSGLDLPVVDERDDTEGYVPALKALRGQGIWSADAMPYGAVVCTARLVQCHKTRDVIGHPEAVFGDFTPGRFAWEFDEVRPLSPPVPCRGFQSIWTWDPATGQGEMGWRP